MSAKYTKKDCENDRTGTVGSQTREAISDGEYTPYSFVYFVDQIFPFRCGEAASGISQTSRCCF